MNPTYQALLYAVLAQPQDDAPRLVLSDWLEEQGQQERAEFIRVQIEVAQREADGRDRSECSWGGTCVCRSHALRRRERALLPGRQRELLLELECLARGFSLTFRRGFVDAVACTCADWCGGPCPECKGEKGSMRDASAWTYWWNCDTCSGTGRIGGHGPAIMRAQPVREVQLTDREPDHEEDNLWRWYAGYEAPDAIPRELARAMTPAIRTHGAFALGNEAAFPSKEAAQQALSAAALLWANRAAWKCPRCDGLGYVQTVDGSGDGCPVCRGAGWFIGAPEPCTTS
jgi:uncharacterized protein (TIGR02996 family)